MSLSFIRPSSIVTRLGLSRRVPGCRGVFAARHIKKFTPIEILPAATAATTGILTPSIPAASSSRVSTEEANRTDEDSQDVNKKSQRQNQRSNDNGSSNHNSNNGSTAQSNAALLIHAPPYMCDLALAPRHSISLRRFLALRHQFSTDSFLHAATSRGWFLLVPSWAVPLQDVKGLREWTSKHHARYCAHNGGGSNAAALGRSAAAARLRHRTFASLSHLETDDVVRGGGGAGGGGGEVDGELTEEQVLALTEQEREALAADGAEDRTAAPEDVDEEVEESEGEGQINESNRQSDDDDGEDVEEADFVTGGLRSPAADSTVTKSPPLIPEEHLFEINDGVLWPLPPADDLANPEYWAGHRARMEVYQGTGGVRAEQRESFLIEALQGVRTPPPSSEGHGAVPTEQQLYAESKTLFDAFTQKANVTVNVEEDTGLVTLTPLRDLNEGEELLLHYGREWWAERLLSRVFLAVEDEQMRQVRWIESLFLQPTDVPEPFPLLTPALQVRRKNNRKSSSKKRSEMIGTVQSSLVTDEASSEDQDTVAAAAAEGQTAGGEREVPAVRVPKAATHTRHDRRRQRHVLYNAATQAKATDAEVLVFAVRHSCQDRDFFMDLLAGRQSRDGSTLLVPPVFNSLQFDKEIPLRVVRRVLLRSLRGLTSCEEDEEEGDSGKRKGLNGDDEDDTFFV